MQVICVCTGTKFDEWYVSNLKYMIDTYANIDYESFNVIRNSKFGGVYDKLLIFDLFRTNQNLYFDLDILIKGDCNKFITKELSVCHAWWRSDGDFYKLNPINSSIISWAGDRSDIFYKFNSNSDYYKRLYDRGIDQYLYDNFKPNTFEEKYTSYQINTKNLEKYDIYLFNQSHTYMKWQKWWKKFVLPT